MATMNKVFEMYMKYERFVESSAHEYTVIINDMLKFVGKADNEITPEDIAEWRDSLEGYSSATIAKKIACVKTYFKVLEDEDTIRKSPAKRLRTPHVVNKKKHHMTLEQVNAMAKATNNLRDRAIIVLVSTGGMRYCEFSNVTVGQYKAMREKNQNAFNIIGKGDKEAAVYFNVETCEAIDAYLKVRCDWGTGCNKLFLSDTGIKTSNKVLNQMLKRVARDAGIEWWEDMSCHQLRAACATIQADAGVPITQIQHIMRHEDITTTQRYTVNSDDIAQQNVMNIHVTF